VTPRPVILLVQQSRDDGLEMYAEFLRFHGFTLMTASNAREALMLAPQADVLVTGIILDDQTDGIELVLRLRHDDGTMHTPIIVLTACAWPRDREHAEHAGCDVFLSKPCLPNDLLREVRRLLAATRPQAGSVAGAPTARSA
jgi:two-component system, cell cycle response regulator DivK